jgi:predicted permease
MTARLDSVAQDIGFALRTMRRNPAFTAVAVISLALGIGANTTIFTLLNAVLLAPLPVARSSELVVAYTTDRVSTVGGLGGLLPMSYLNFKDLREENQYLTDMAAYSMPVPVSLVAAGEPQQGFAELVTGTYFAVLGVEPELGRFFLSHEDTTPGRNPVVVLSHGCWRRRFGGDRAVIGRTVSLNGAAFTVIGVTREGFNGVNSLFSPDAWVPSAMAGTVLPIQMRAWMNERRALLFFVAGRLRPGATVGQAEANLETLAAALEREYPEPNRGRSVALRRLAEATIFPGFRDTFVRGGAVLMTIVGLVLLIACANVANLLVARGAARRQEVAVRLALGASRARLAQQLVTESLLLAALGGALGLVIASAARDGIWSLRPPFLAQNLVNLTFDGRVFAFTALASVATGLVFGLIPARLALRADVIGPLKDESRGSGPSRGRAVIGRVLVTAQVALSVVALVAAGLFLRSLERANDIDPGFDVEHVAVVGVNPGQAGYDGARAAAFYRTVRDRVASGAGVDSAAWASAAPLSGGLLRTVIKEGEDPGSTAGRNMVTTIVSGPAYFQTIGIPLLHGRDFTDADREGSVRVAIVNQTFADRVWPGGDPIGKRFRFYTDAFHHQVIGVAKTSKYMLLGEDPQPAAYVPLEQNPADTMVLILKTRGTPGAVLGAAQHDIRAIDARVPITNPFTLREVVRQSLWPARLAAILLGALGTLALALASVGVYGVVAYAVAQRTREIGVRMALGADRSRVLSMVLRQAMGPVGLGIAIGVAGALAVSRLAARLLYGLRATDPLTFAGVTALLLLVALVASWIPAWRASRLDPLRALR